MHRRLEAFVDICLILFFEDQDPKTESRFSPKIMQIRCKQGGLEDKDPKIESGLVPKSCTYAVNQVVWRIRVPNLNLDLVPRSCKYGVNQVVWKIRDPKTGSGSSPNIMQKHSKPGSLKDQDPKSTVSKINFAS